MLVLQTVFGHYAEGLSSQYQFALLGLSLIGILIAFAIRRQFVTAVADIFVRERRWILLLWSFGYLLFLIVQRSRSFFDVDARTIAPAGIVLVILWSGAVVRATRIRPAGTAAVALALLLLAIGQETTATVRRPRLDLDRHVQRSQRLAWLARNTSDQDLIIGDDVVDIPFFLRRPATLSFSPYPYTDYADYEKIMAYARMHCADYRTIFLVLRTVAPVEDWRSAFGDFFADLIDGKADKYPGIVPLETLDGALVFQIICR